MFSIGWRRDHLVQLPQPLRVLVAFSWFVYASSSAMHCPWTFLCNVSRFEHIYYRHDGRPLTIIRPAYGFVIEFYSSTRVKICRKSVFAVQCTFIISSNVSFSMFVRSYRSATCLLRVKNKWKTFNGTAEEITRVVYFYTPVFAVSRPPSHVSIRHSEKHDRVIRRTRCPYAVRRKK